MACLRAGCEDEVATGDEDPTYCPVLVLTGLDRFVEALTKSV